MAFFEVWNMKEEIEEYLVEHDSWVDDPSSREIIHIAFKQIESAAEFSKRVFVSDDFNAPIEGIMDALSNFKGEIESHISKKMDPESEGIRNLEKEIDIFTQKINKLEADYADDLYKFPGGEDEDEDEEVVSNGGNSNMVGFADYYDHLKQMLYIGKGNRFEVVSLCGMSGIGKTTLAREIYKDSDIVEQFPCRVWVKVGRKCGFKEMLRHILAEVSPDEQIHVEEDEDIIGRLNECLKGKTYLIVLDDVWDRFASLCLYRKAYSSRKNELIDIFPSENNGGRLLVISRIQKSETFVGIDMELMDKEESWLLLRDKVFGQERCPYKFEKIGRKIAEKCEGLPLTIVTVANLLSKEDMTVEFWNAVAMRKKHQLFETAYDEILKVLLPSYINLPRFLQMCFMYIGAFNRYNDIARSKVMNVWLVDGFLQYYRNSPTDYKDIECLEELVSNNMVMICKMTITHDESIGDQRIKTSRLHTSLWHLSNREGRRSKFFYVLESIDDCFGEDIMSQPRLSFHNNVLFAIKDVHEFVEDNCASSAHSLFCYGPYLQYQVPICFGLRLLNRLDALTIRLYEFPLEVLQLIELRYLALTMNGNLPASISQLSKLQFLIVHPHQSIKSIEESSYLPMEIWDMKELQHLQVVGKDLPNPCGASLERLRTLSRISPNNCSVDVFNGIRDINKLGIEVELSDEIDGEPFSCLAHVSHLENLQSLKFVVVNPNLIPSFSPLSSFPSRLRKLTLNGLGYAWEEMNKIGSLEYLLTLKLQNYAFQGPQWDVRDGQFNRLSSLTIEDTDMEKWRIGCGLRIQRLIIKHCYELEEIDGYFSDSAIEVEMVDCNHLVTEKMLLATGLHAKVRVSCSWYDEKGRA